MAGGRIQNWSTWCTKISEELTLALRRGTIKEVKFFKIHKV